MQLIGSKKIIGGLLVAGALTLGSVAGFAQQQTPSQEGGQQQQARAGWGKGRKGMRGKRGGLFAGRFAEKLNLTDAQKEQMRQIAARYREGARAARQQRGAQRGGMDLLNGGAFDEAAVRAAAQARANARVEREVARARMMSEMYNVLTPEQKSQLATLRQQWEQKRQQRRALRNAAPGQTRQQ